MARAINKDKLLRTLRAMEHEAETSYSGLKPAPLIRKIIDLAEGMEEEIISWELSPDEWYRENFGGEENGKTKRHQSREERAEKHPDAKG